MKKKINKQEDLFNTSRINELQQQVHAMDSKISLSLKNCNYVKAKEYTSLQKEFIQELMKLGENYTD